MGKPRVSVLMGVYNCAPYLQEALDSLFSQTFQDFRIIICEDGSTDNTYSIAKSYADKSDKIVLIRNDKNMGLNYSLNRCLSLVETEYCARMDGDDISLPKRFETEVKFLDEHPEYAIVSSPMEYFDENGTFMVGHGKGEIYKKDFIHGSPICHAPCMVRYEAYINVGGYSESEEFKRQEDYLLWLKMYTAGYKAYMLPDAYYKMRDDRNARGRRKWHGRVKLSKLMRIGFRMLGLPRYYDIYSFRPLLVGLLPSPVYDYLHRRKMR